MYLRGVLLCARRTSHLVQDNHGLLPKNSVFRMWRQRAGDQANIALRVVRGEAASHAIQQLILLARGRLRGITEYVVDGHAKVPSISLGVSGFVLRTNLPRNLESRAKLAALPVKARDQRYVIAPLATV